MAQKHDKHSGLDDRERGEGNNAIHYMPPQPIFGAVKGYSWHDR